MNLIPIPPMVLQEAAKRSTADEGAVLLVFGAVCGLFAAAIWIRAALKQWRFRAACVRSHMVKKYGVCWTDETHGGQAEHYGWPRRSVGIEWSWRRNTWFVGWELWPVQAGKGDE